MAQTHHCSASCIRCRGTEAQIPPGIVIVTFNVLSEALSHSSAYREP
jgi:hypothetical protein